MDPSKMLMVEKDASETSLILNLFLFLSILPEYRAVSKGMHYLTQVILRNDARLD